MKKRLLPLLLAASMILAVAGCGGKTNTDNTPAQTEISADEQAPEVTAEPTATPEATAEPTAEPTPEPTPKPVVELGTKVTEEIPYIELEDDIEWRDMLASMGMGFNLGNTFDSNNCDSWISGEMAYEVAWLPEKTYTSQAIINCIADAGFKTVRLPASWHNHYEKVKNDDGTYTYTINKQWLDRYQEVVDYCVKAGLNVIINIHHDDASSMLVYPDSTHEASSISYITQIWTQLAERFGDYDLHVIFESFNEVRLTGASEWDATASTSKKAQNYINEFNQVIVDTIRTTPGKYNAARYIGCPGYAAALAGADEFVLPEDPGPYSNRIMYAVHCYTPYQFASGQSIKFTNGVKSSLGAMVKEINTKFLNKDIPAYIGEWGVVLGDDNHDARMEYMESYRKMLDVIPKDSNGDKVTLPALVWDNYQYGGKKAGSEKFGHLDRLNLKWYDPEYIKAMTEELE